jgi:threonine aldolase
MRDHDACRNLSGDNGNAVAPELMRALLEAARNDASPYGDDSETHNLRQVCASYFGTPVRVFPVATGTAANCISAAALAEPGQTLLCHAHSHLYGSEAGAFEMFSDGARLTPVDGEDGKLRTDDLAREIHRLRSKPDGAFAPVAVSVSQPTESGTLYAADELDELAAHCERLGVFLHMDGARLFYALAATGSSIAEMTWKAGVAALSLGMTKCGAAFGEVIVLFEENVKRHGADVEALSRALLRQRRRGGHAIPRMHLVSAQMSAMIRGGLWNEPAKHANRLARRLEDELRAARVPLRHPVQTNQVFGMLPAPLADALRRAGWRFRDWPNGGAHCRRFVLSGTSREETVDLFAAELAELSR